MTSFAEKYPEETWLENTLENYAKRTAARFGIDITSGEVIAKVLTTNDDSGRHGVLIPSDVYTFFPDFVIPDATQNATLEFQGCDVIEKKRVALAYKYYERYPERRITRLNPIINNRNAGKRLIIYSKLRDKDGRTDYYVDAVLESDYERFYAMVEMLFGNDVLLVPGVFIRKEITASRFQIDAVLASLLVRFDDVKQRGWIASLRSGDTGVGYTFETLLGITENNNKDADYDGIEIKCKQKKAGRPQTGKVNLFQQAPEWAKKMSGLDRLKMLGKQGVEGLYSCHSQVTTLQNNINLRLALLEIEQRIDLLKAEEEVGSWKFDILQQRLAEKHNRAVFIKAAVKTDSSGVQFQYNELVYCERPSIQRFVDLVKSRDIVFEFIMSEKEKGTVRNHGYPWRLTSVDLLDSLFSLQVKLRS